MKSILEIYSHEYACETASRELAAFVADLQRKYDLCPAELLLVQTQATMQTIKGFLDLTNKEEGENE